MVEDLILNGGLIPELQPQDNRFGDVVIPTEIPLSNLLPSSNVELPTEKSESLKPFIKYGTWGIVLVILLLIFIKLKK